MKDLGPVVPVVTPCARDGSPDLEGFRAVCDEMLAAGCRGVFVGGTTGRGPWFGLADRKKLCRAAAGQTRGKALLLAGCSGSGLPGMLESAQAMADEGAQVCVATVPGYFHYNQLEIETIYLRFADACPIPVMVYDIPEFTNVKLGQTMLRKLSSHGNVIGFKDSSADFRRFEELASSLGSLPNFYLMQGKENLLADSLRIGASGFIVSLLHLDPRPFVAVYNMTRAGDQKGAQAVQARITKVIDIVRETIEARPESSTLFHLLNHALRKRGVCENILLEHDGEAPAWVLENADRAIDLCLGTV